MPGTVTAPEPLTSNLTCPHCRQFLAAYDRTTGATWQPRKPPSRLPRQIGKVANLVGLAGFCVTLWNEDHRFGAHYETTISAAAFNPVFLLGVSLGIFLLRLKDSTARGRVS